MPLTCSPEMVLRESESWSFVKTLGHFFWDMFLVTHNYMRVSLFSLRRVRRWRPVSDAWGRWPWPERPSHYHSDVTMSRTHVWAAWVLADVASRHVYSRSTWRMPAAPEAGPTEQVRLHTNAGALSGRCFPGGHILWRQKTASSGGHSGSAGPRPYRWSDFGLRLLLSDFFDTYIFILACEHVSW